MWVSRSLHIECFQSLMFQMKDFSLKFKKQVLLVPQSNFVNFLLKKKIINFFFDENTKTLFRQG